jgi:hypothetical protein
MRPSALPGTEHAASIALPAGSAPAAGAVLMAAMAICDAARGIVMVSQAPGGPG